jgi:hypothetical protein
MEFPVPAYTSFTIPTGATTGARVVFNEDGSGTIRVYNSSNVLTDEIGGDFGAININGAYAGNADSRLVGGEIEFGTAPGFSNPARIHANPASLGAGQLFIDSGKPTGAGYDEVVVGFISGQNAQAPGGVDTPYVYVSDGNSSSSADLRLSGAVIATDTSQVMETWHSANYFANWVNGGAFSGLGGDPLQTRRMAEDDVWLLGLAQANAGAGTFLALLPVGQRPVSGTPHGIAHRDRGGVITTVEFAVVTTGEIIIGQPIAAGDVYSFNVRIPRNNVA